MKAFVVRTEMTCEQEVVDGESREIQKRFIVMWEAGAARPRGQGAGLEVPQLVGSSPALTIKLEQCAFAGYVPDKQLIRAKRIDHRLLTFNINTFFRVIIH